MFPYPPFGIAGGLSGGGFGQKLRLVRRFYAHVLMLGLMDFVMYIDPCTGPCCPDCLFREAGRFLGFLFCQLFFGLFKLSSRMFRLFFGLFRPFLLFVFPFLGSVCFSLRSVAAALIVLAHTGRRLLPFLVLSEFAGAFPLRANLARGGGPAFWGGFFLGKVEPPALDTLAGMFFDRNDLLP